MTPLIICAAVTGGAPPKSRTPYHPVKPKEIIKAAVECWNEGAAMIHLHARSEDGEPLMDTSAYEDICAGIRAQGCDAILNLSAGDNGGRATHEERIAILETSAEMISLDAGSFNIGNRVYDNSPDYLCTMSEKMLEKNKTPEIEVFDTGHLHGVRTLIEAGTLKPPYFIQFVFGPPGAMKPRSELLNMIVSDVPENTEWAVSCQTPDIEEYRKLMLWTFANGGHVRTGMEDIVHLRPDELASTNAEMVSQWVSTANTWGREIATPVTARKALGITLPTP